ncbi:MAG: class 1a ribonucleoside-diphosphate reductase subunit alpha, partial [Rheinheimera sp.]
MAARLAVFHLRKKAYGQFEPPKLYDHVVKMVEDHRYDAHILADYTVEELNEIDSFIDHSRDMNFSYAAVKQLEGKYLVQNRVTGEIYESAQFLYILVAACLFANYPKATRLTYLRRFYDAVSLFKISLPTPIMSGVRTPTRQFSSCVLIECGDSLDSINATSSAIVKYVSQRAGIGINAGRIRALGSPIRNGEAFHTGCIPFYKHFQTAVKSCSQGGVRGGAATLFYPLWHLEVESLLVLKNNRGVEENRVRHLDYGVQFNRLMYTRLIKDDFITLFSPSDVPGLYDAFFQDQDLFEQLYVQYEVDPAIRKKRIKALELFTLFMQERASTGRIYLQNVDHCNTHSPFDPAVAPVRQSNLCLEIALPTKPLNDVNDPNGEIALCTLSAFNLGAIDNLDELEELAELAVRALDSLLGYQDYPIPAAFSASMGRRTLGVGVINYAYYLAKNGVRYSDGSANALTHRTFEAIQYYL